MSDQITVHVVNRGRRYLYLRYTDPITGRQFERSSGCRTKKEARKAAGKWESELQAGIATTRRVTKWPAFRKAYVDFAKENQKPKTVEKIWSMFNVIDDLMKPDKLQRITRNWIDKFRTELRKHDREPSSVESHCRHLKAALNWAKEKGMLQTVPTFPKPSKKARTRKKMKGRPITGEEFDRYIASVEQYFRQLTANRRRKGEVSRDIKVSESDRERIASIEHLLRGLWLSGLRLGEALSLTWNQWADGIRIDASGRFVKLLIFAEDEKGGQDRVYPVTPDFQEFLLSVPPEDRTGFVFNPRLHRGVCHRVDTVSEKLVEIGKTAAIKVDERNGEAVYASAHDLRRSFGTRWAKRGLSVFHLKELMRHSSVKTTEQYYIDIKADETAAAVLHAFNASRSDTLGDTYEKTVPEGTSNTAISSEGAGT